MAESTPIRKWFKGKAALAIDEWYRGGADVGNRLDLARRVLESGDSFDRVISSLGNQSHPDFVYPLGRGKLQGDKFEKVMRRGYLEAIALALRPDREPPGPVPISTYWMTGAGNREFEMHITDEAREVSVTLLVPDVEGGAESEESPESWVVALGDDQEAQAIRTSGPKDREPPTVRWLSPEGAA